MQSFHKNESLITTLLDSGKAVLCTHKVALVTSHWCPLWVITLSKLCDNLHTYPLTWSARVGMVGLTSFRSCSISPFSWEVAGKQSNVIIIMSSVYQMAAKKISKRVQQIRSYWTHGYGKFTCTCARQVYLCVLLMQRKFTGCMAVRVCALYEYMPCTAQTVGHICYLAIQIAGTLRPVL